jgi:hypothetical protein
MENKSLVYAFPTSPAMLLQVAGSVIRRGTDAAWSIIRWTNAVWPDRLTTFEFVLLQYPWIGTVEEKKQASQNQIFFRRVVDEAIEKGDLEAEKEVFKTRIPFGLMSRPRNLMFAKYEEIELTMYVVKPDAVNVWLKNIKEAPGKLISAWLEAKGTPSPVHAGPAPASPPESYKRQSYPETRIREILKIIQKKGWNAQCLLDGAKSEIRQECLLHPDLFTKATFESAWKSARKNDSVKMENHNTYAKRK